MEEFRRISRKIIVDQVEALQCAAFVQKENEIKDIINMLKRQLDKIGYKLTEELRYYGKIYID